MTDMHREALLRGRAQDEEPRVRHACSLGVGCEEYGLCYAEAHGQPEQCGKPSAMHDRAALRYRDEQEKQA